MYNVLVVEGARWWPLCHVYSDGDGVCDNQSMLYQFLCVVPVNSTTLIAAWYVGMTSMILCQGEGWTGVREHVM